MRTIISFVPRPGKGGGASSDLKTRRVWVPGRRGNKEGVGPEGNAEISPAPASVVRETVSFCSPGEEEIHLEPQGEEDVAVVVLGVPVLTLTDKHMINVRKIHSLGASAKRSSLIGQP